jgi:hypothetical protein
VEAGQNETKSFVFVAESFVTVAEYLIGAVLGKKSETKNKFRRLVTKLFTETDEAFLYVVWVNALVNVYDP